MSKNRFSWPSIRVRLWELLSAAGAVACIPTLLAFLGSYHWALDLFSHFRVQYLAGLLAISACLVLGKRYRIACIFLAFAVINGAYVLPLYYGKEPAPATAHPPHRVMLSNLSTRPRDPSRVRKVISAADPDFMVLLEINKRWTDELTWLNTQYPHQVVESREDYFGIGLYSKWPILDSDMVDVAGIGIPTLVATLQAPDGALRILGTHPLPPINRESTELRNRQLAQLPNFVTVEQPFLLVGDLNVTPWNHNFRQLVKASGLRDSAKGFGVQPTWPNFNPFLRIPIDHCLHSKDIVIIDRSVGDDVASDHFPLIVDFVITGERGGHDTSD